MSSVFTYEEGGLLVRLLIAHIIADFLLQTEKGITIKKEKLLKAKPFWFHGFYIGIITALFMWDKFSFIPFLIIAASHLVIDYLKLLLHRKVNKEKYKHLDIWLFIIDQILHIAILVIAWLILIKGFGKMQLLLSDILPDYRILLRMLGYLIIIGPVTYLIKFLTLRWADDVIEINNSLKDAGKWIGILERILVITLVFIEQYTAIGFLVTAKSILRLIDKPETDEEKNPVGFSSRKHTEYVLIGTFLSFGFALLVGLSINRLLKV